MNRLDLLWGEFRHISLRKERSVILLKARDASNCLERGLKLGYSFVSLEGFVLHANGIQPDQDLSLDERYFSNPEELIKQVRDLLSREMCNDRVAFEVWFEE